MAERESGPLRVLEDLRIIVKPPNLRKTAVNEAKCFYLNDAHNDRHLAWSIVTQKCMVEESLRRLSNFIKTWDTVAAEMYDAPKALSTYVASYDKILSLLKIGDSYRLRGEYLPDWTARGYLLELIFQKGFIEVSLDKEVSLEQFLVVNPDQHDHLRKLQRYFSRMTHSAENCTTISCQSFGDSR